MSRLRDLFHTIYYWVNVWTWVRLVILLVINRDVRGLERIPRKGPLILACNHQNLADPPIITAVFPRRIAWMTKQELFDIPVFGVLYHLFGCIPVKRFHGDLRALRRSQQALKRGHVLGMFPEGTRSSGEGLTAAEPGTAFIAMRANVPIVPAAIWGTEHVKLPRDFFRRTDANIVFGEPFYLPCPERITKEAVEEGAEVIMRKIAELLPPPYRGRYADSDVEAIKTEAGGS